MSERQMKKLIKFWLSGLLLIVLTFVGYFKGTLTEEEGEPILAKPRSRSII